jgi:hypothetical protein
MNVRCVDCQLSQQFIKNLYVVAYSLKNRNNIQPNWTFYKGINDLIKVKLI